VATILLNRGKGIVKFKSGKHRFNEVLKPMASRPCIVGVVLRPADVFLINVDSRLVGAFLAFAFLLIFGFFLSVLFGSGCPLFFLLV